jgi:hypothetical protein
MGGVNSTAMIIDLYERGFRYPIVFADTWNEQPETYLYLDYFSTWLMNKYQTEIIILSPMTHPLLYAKRIRNSGVESIESYCTQSGVLPLRGIRWCTRDWKRDPLRRWGREKGIFTHIIGIAAEEHHRSKEKADGKYQNWYPLIEGGIDRAGCKEIIWANGLELPKKSGCFFCPYQSQSEWKNLWVNHPELFNRSIKLEILVSDKLGYKTSLNSSGFQLEEFVKGWQQERPLFKIDDSSVDRHSCYMCHK